MQRSEMNYTPQFRLGGHAYRPTIEDSDTSLFVVFAQRPGYDVTMSCYAFASSSERAIHRVRNGVTALLEAARAKDDASMVRRLERIDNSKWYAHPVDEADILTASPVWADNDGLEVS